MVEPRYQELLNKDIPAVTKDGVHVTVIAGNSLGASVSISWTVAMVTVAMIVSSSHIDSYYVS